MRGRLIGVGLVLASFLLWGLAGAAEPGSGEPQLVHDFFPGEFEGAESLKQLTQLGDALFFVVDDLETAGPRVWRTDGTPEGTRQVQAVGRPEEEGDHQSIVGPLGKFMLWVSVPAEDPEAVLLLSSTEQGDGVPLRTYRPGPGDLFALTSKGFFFQDCTAACTVWSTDGTVAGTQPVRALASRFPGAVLRLAGTFADRWLLFQVKNDLFAYDAVIDRVLLVLPDQARRAQIIPAGDSLFFRTIHEQGTKQRARLWISRLDSPRAAQIFEDTWIDIAGWREGRLYFASANGRLWSTGGRKEDTRSYSRLKVPSSSFSDLVNQLGAIGSQTLVPVPGYYLGGLLTTDETKSEASLVKVFCRGKYPCLAVDISAFTSLGEKAFGAVNGSLWKTDGTREGTTPDEILSQVNVDSFRVLDGRLLLGATSREGEQQLWETDGTAGGTRALSDGTPDRPFRVQGPPVPVGGGLFVVAERKPVGQQLWRVADGRATPLTSVRHLAIGTDPYSAFPLGGGRLVFYGARTSEWRGLGGDGPTGPLPMDTSFCSSFDAPCPKEPVVIGNHLFFPSDYPSEGLGFTDGTVEGTGFVPLKDEEGASDPLVYALGRLGDRALALGPAGGLWTSDGTAAGTRLFARLPEELGATPVGPPVSLGSLAFLFRRVALSEDPEEPAGLEVWRTDGTEAGTLRLASTPFPKTSRASSIPWPRAAGFSSVSAARCG